MSDFNPKMHQIQFRLGLLRRSAVWGSLQRSPDPLAGLKGPTSNRGKRRGDKGKGREGKGREMRGSGGKGRVGNERRGKGGRKKRGMCPYNEFLATPMGPRS